MCHSSLWSASLFRDNQTAVEAGNGAAFKKLIAGTIFFANIWPIVLFSVPAKRQQFDDL
jgi:hypothetical protein